MNSEDIIVYQGIDFFLSCFSLIEFQFNRILIEFSLGEEDYCFIEIRVVQYVSIYLIFKDNLINICFYQDRF